ncbi:MAG: hypothetical protein K0R89_2981 [Ramlibacter sp.]|jgi:hypothetical protein|nr:hypothetical protein [Ramlibacter sp.]MCD6079037.1 hypothetical protein [Ramlibacter sp.]
MTLPRSLTALPALAAAGAHAHPGHGILQDVHWHASDAWGFLVVGALAAAAIWYFGKK